MTALSSTTLAQMSAAIQDARRAFAKARPVVEDAASGIFATDAAKATLTAFNQSEMHMERWATQGIAWVEDGSWTLENWFSVGLDLVKAAAAHAGYAYDATLYRVVKDTATATADTVTDPTKWAPRLQVAAGGLVALVLLVLAVRLLK